MSGHNNLVVGVVRVPRIAAPLLVAACLVTLPLVSHAIPALPKPMVSSETKPLEDDYIQFPEGGSQASAFDDRSNERGSPAVATTTRHVALLRLFVLRTLFNILPR